MQQKLSEDLAKTIDDILDYAEETQTDMIQEAITFSRKRGFIPYISTYTLDEIFYHTLTP